MEKKINNIITWVFTNPEIELILLKDEILEQLDSYENLKEGWDFGEGMPMSQLTISNAKYIYDICYKKGFNVEPHANTEGDITLIAYLDDYFLEIDVNESKSLLLRYAQGKGDNYTLIWKNRKNSFSELEDVLSEIKSEWQRNTSLEQFTSRNIRLSNNDLEATKSLILSEDASPFLVNPVQELHQTTIFAYT